MNELFYYNPENDIALAVNPAGSFTPPRQAALLARYGAPLMWWLGDSSDMVLLPETLSADEELQLSLWHAEVSNRFGGGPKLVRSLAGLSIEKLSPWGWSRPTIDKLIHVGAHVELLDHIPADSIRRISHRHTAGLINDAIRSSQCSSWGNIICAESAFEAHSVAQAMAYISASDASEIYLKSPWSSSGRGVVSSRDLTPDQLVSRFDGVIRRQGSILIERGYEKILDFAMLFHADETGQICYIGLSSFFNGRSDVSYNGNLVTSDSAIMSDLCRYLPMRLLTDLISILPPILTGIISGAYSGYFGIDMMVISSSASPTGFAVVPCVELNLRMTMGVVAHRLFSRLGNVSGVMKVIPSTGGAEALPENALPLVPLNEYFNIVFIQAPPLRREV